MRGSPSCVVEIRRFGAWRVAVGVVAAAAIGTLCAWLVLAPWGQVTAARIAVGLAALSTLALATSLFRMPSGTLRWSGSSWSFSDLAAASATPVTGDVDVALDLGAFLLLRFACLDTRGRRKVRWLAVQRRGLEREWHSFRCAVYSPRPAPGPADAADLRPH
jgi:hypothetical protein